MEKMLRNKQINVNNLDRRLYPNGRVYFEKGKRMFKGDNPCTNCVIVHNNWIVSAAAKIYRFKECGLWENDRNGYYSNDNNKYISFDLPGDYGSEDTGPAEIKALKYAMIIGAILDRIVILPQFHCYGCKYNHICKSASARCAFGTFYEIDAFDSVFKEIYRESVFLSHFKVSKLVKGSLSPRFVIETPENQKNFPELPVDVTKMTARGSNGAAVDEILLWFGNNTESVLRFHSLYNGIDCDDNSQRIEAVTRKIKTAFIKSNYRQRIVYK
jgi:hypothetical protein